MRSYDAVVIGSGQVGEPLAIDFARAGLQTVLVDSDHDATCACCGPSNAMLASANVARLARRAADFGVETGSVEVDFGKVQLRRLSVMDGFRTQAMQALETTPGLTVLKGEAQFQNPESLVVRDNGDAAVELQAARIFINTGAYPALPDLPGLANVPYLTSSSAMDLECLPEELLVLGGSYLGVELGQIVIVVAALLVLHLIEKNVSAFQPAPSTRLVHPLSMLVLVLGVYWTIARVIV